MMLNLLTISVWKSFPRFFFIFLSKSHCHFFFFNGKMNSSVVIRMKAIWFLLWGSQRRVAYTISPGHGCPTSSLKVQSKLSTPFACLVGMKTFLHTDALQIFLDRFCPEMTNNSLYNVLHMKYSTACRSCSRTDFSERCTVGTECAAVSKCL